ncbi:hypothetical protein LEN26_000520 [Aphanomyces euteiches]|nr:hypothetical protein AeMF1_016057 [Aphanomyces euteiches]KAH9163420.1 hypothetical protein LEN26_000520 [Aphanomyces euteiches]KAH9191900.1 hypothetical protein AeNC1_006125 [Aphanomyces euteiches]
MIRSMLRLRFTDAVILKRFLGADTNTKKETFWCYFAAVLTNEVGVAVTAKRLRDKYKKVKCEYKAHADDLNRTGNQEPRAKPPRYLPILQEWFSGKTGVANEVMFDSNDSDDEQRESADESQETTVPKKPFMIECTTKPKAGVNLLAHEMGRGREAIAEAFKTSRPTDDLAALLRSTHEENRSVLERMVEMQQRQNALMEQLITAIAQKE